VHSSGTPPRGTKHLELRVIKVDTAMTEDDLAERVTEALGL